MYNFTGEDVCYISDRICNSFDSVKSIRNSRVGKVKELHPVMITLYKPRNRLFFLRHRYGNVIATFMEYIWIIAGKNDLDFIKEYLPRAHEFSDDGKTWRAGYGPRIFNYGNEAQERVNQLEYVVDKLKKNKDDRQAMMIINNPVYDILDQPTKDYPCTQCIHFVVNDKGGLDCEVFIRSNDFVWGFTHINVFEFTALQALVAKKIRRKVGNFYYFVSSLHVYEGMFKRLEKFREGLHFNPYIFFSDSSLKEDYMTGVDEVAAKKYCHRSIMVRDDKLLGRPEYKKGWDVFIFMIELHNFMKHFKLRVVNFPLVMDIFNDILKIDYPDIKLALCELLFRWAYKQKKSFYKYFDCRVYPVKKLHFGRRFHASFGEQLYFKDGVEDINYANRILDNIFDYITHTSRPMNLEVKVTRPEDITS